MFADKNNCMRRVPCLHPSANIHSRYMTAVVPRGVACSRAFSLGPRAHRTCPPPEASSRASAACWPALSRAPPLAFAVSLPCFRHCRRRRSRPCHRYQYRRVVHRCALIRSGLVGNVKVPPRRALLMTSTVFSCDGFVHTCTTNTVQYRRTTAL